jgi:hypothetical protein
VHPGVVVGCGVEREPGEPAGLGVPDDLFGAGTLAVSQLERGDVAAGGVGDEGGVAKAFDGVEQRELRARVWAVPAHDQPGAVRPRVQVHQLGELDDVGAVTVAATGLDGW